MFIWIILFIIVVLVSFFLALRSMKDFWESPGDFTTNYSLFLIQNPQALTADLLKELHQRAQQEGLIISLEKLFKGQRQALVILGPLNLLLPLQGTLQLLELEDYTQKAVLSSLSAWQVGLKINQKDLEIKEVQTIQVELQDNEQFWWQMVLRPKEGTFQVATRAVAVSPNKERLVYLREALSKLGSNEGLATLPQAYSTGQIVDFYQKRSVQTTLTLGKERSIFYLLPNQVLAVLNLVQIR